MALPVQFFAVLLLAASASAQVNLYCPILGTTTYAWFPEATQYVNVQTTLAGMPNYGPSMSCNFEITITANTPGRIAVRVYQSNIWAYNGQISIRTGVITGYLADWSQLTYNPDRHSNFVSTTTTKLYISFTSAGSPIRLDGILQLQLTFLRADLCLPTWRPLTLANSRYCIGRPIVKGFKFGEAQRYCNLWRSNLLVSDRDNVTNALGYVNAINAWIGMTAEPSGTYSVYRWINKSPVDRNQPVACDSGCTQGSTKHRCVQARNQLSLAQVNCDTPLEPICYMPAGGTDVFFDGSRTLQASGALLSGAMLLVWSLLR